jgi:hypothetical protein
VGSGSSPNSCGVLLPLTLLQAFPLLVAGRTPLLPPEPLWPGPACLFTVLERIPLPCSLELRAPHPLCNMSLLFLLLITQFLFFPWVKVGLSRGAMLFWPRVVCGSTVYHLAHLVHVFPSHLGMGNWWPRGPPGFSVLHDVEILCAGWRCGRSKFCLFSVVLSARSVSSISPRFHYRRHAFCFLSLATILESTLNVES